jgi:hypothetical protein
MKRRASAWSALHRIFRREVRAFRHDLVEIFDDDRRIVDDLPVVIERRHHAVGIEREIVRLELVAREQIEFRFFEGLILGVEDKPHALRTGRLRRVIEHEGHNAFPGDMRSSSRAQS